MPVKLPIDALLPDVLARLRDGSNLVIEAPPGAGKTTRVPPALLQAVTGNVLVLEPRRIAARMAARRVAQERGEPIGETHHLLSDIINGLVGAGLAIRGLWENPRPDVPLDQQVLPGDKSDQQARHLPFGISVIAQKR